MGDPTIPTITRLSAELAAAWPAQPAGCVHSVFLSALNVMLNCGRMITLLDAGRPMQPYSLALSRDACIPAMALSPGDPVRLEPQRLRLGRWTIGLSGTAQVVSHRMPVTQQTGIPPDCGERLRVIASVIGDSPGAENGLAPVLCGLYSAEIPYTLEQNVYSSFLMERIKRLDLLLSSADGDTLREAGARFAGCGMGLTPSSDDFLCGVMAALYQCAAAGMPYPADTAARCGALAAGAYPNTGDISAGFIRSSGEGLFGEDILAVLARFFARADMTALRQSARRVAAFGSTSGTDILTGIWFGLHHVQNQNTRDKALPERGCGLD